MTKGSIRQQVEQIVDEGSGRTRQVIVRMKSADRDLVPVLRSASSNLVERRLSLGAREVWTGALERSKGRRSPTAKRLRAPARLTAVPRQKLKSIGQSCANRLRKSKIVAKYEEKASRGMLAWFTSSRKRRAGHKLGSSPSVWESPMPP